MSGGREEYYKYDGDEEALLLPPTRRRPIERYALWRQIFRAVGAGLCLVTIVVFCKYKTVREK